MKKCNHGWLKLSFCKDCRKYTNENHNIYTCIKGEILIGKLVNETRQGYRVKGGRAEYDHIVFKCKVRSGWATKEQKPFFTECSFTSFADAKGFSAIQLLSMEGFYKDKLLAINVLKQKLENKGG